MGKVRVTGFVLAADDPRQLVSFGFCSPKVTLSRLPGWEPESWAYHSDDGQIFNTSQHGRAYGQKYGPQDTVGCGVNFRTGTAFFTRNGVNIGTHHATTKLVKSDGVQGLLLETSRVTSSFPALA